MLMKTILCAFSQRYRQMFEVKFCTFKKEVLEAFALIICLYIKVTTIARNGFLAKSKTAELLSSIVYSQDVDRGLRSIIKTSLQN